MGNFLKNLRKQHGYTQEGLAKELHVTHQLISGWEHDMYNIPNVMLIALAKLYNITVDEILNAGKDTNE
ncbi:XRE family transcriptional regulator [Periweissella cryptocerci]|uniref:XRE family transcriptional regulator n=1 Tax=Periweissella cryptocerci TaxID=2506420 RepID=A0A4P6YWJ5_9LACO|nr:helix-turn-helix transcriptional regulator [Periweissella cryptocerci]QBO37208.1 XRE family transcriptional regulator [Periweissella cryptocerci]